MRIVFGTAVVIGTAAFVLALSACEAGAEPVVSSWYGPGFEGRTTASGEVYRSDGYTAAHRSLPFGTRLLVGYGGRRVIVEVNDRGPYVGGRDLDLSRAAAERVGLTAAGAVAVDARILVDSEDHGRDARSGGRGHAYRERVSDERSSAEGRGRGGGGLLKERPYLKVLLSKVPAPYSRVRQEETSPAYPTPAVPRTRLPEVRL